MLLLLTIISLLFALQVSAIPDPPIVCLDPGHPSELNPGDTIQNDLTEVHINWIVALEMKALLESAGIKVVLTKSEENQLVTNEERARIANDSDADLFFRIHCDSFHDPSVGGMTFYYPDCQGEWDGNIGPSLEIIPLCESAANTIHDIAFESIGDLLRDRGVKTDNETYVGSRQGGALRGSILSEVPVVLVELCFLSSPDDASLISDTETREIITTSLVNGIVEYLAL